MDTINLSRFIITNKKPLEKKGTEVRSRKDFSRFMVESLEKKSAPNVDRSYPVETQDLFVSVVKYGDEIHKDAGVRNRQLSKSYSNKLNYEMEIYKSIEDESARYKPGIFEMHTIGYLLDEYYTRFGGAAYDEPGTGTFKIIQQVDIGELQADPNNNRDSIFQIASNLNCLEGGVGQYKKTPTYTVYSMLKTPVQGERAAISTVAGALLRRYMTRDSDLLTETYGKSNNFIRLDELGTFKINNFDGRYNKANLLNKFQTRSSERNFILNFIREISCGFQSDTQVSARTLDRTNKTLEYVSPSYQQFIHQVFTAVFDWRNYHENNKFSTDETKAFMVVNFCLLFASYCGSIIWAILKGIKKVYLTAVGISAFANRGAPIGPTYHQGEIAGTILLTMGILMPLIERHNLTVILNSDELYEVNTKANAITNTLLSVPRTIPKNKSIFMNNVCDVLIAQSDGIYSNGINKLDIILKDLQQRKDQPYSGGPGKKPTGSIQRFIDGQNDRYHSNLTNYEVAIKEMKAGKKIGHWIYYIFPQPPFGNTKTSLKYSIYSMNEAQLYVCNPILKKRYLTVINLLIQYNGDLHIIFSHTDFKKIHSSLTLFAHTGDEEVKNAANILLNKHFKGYYDKKAFDWIKTH